mmetsp:Transcript_7172/g.14485  ORF Transcript_7172/g.14485 Transcript_7172/m.14485 type:complete len:217 (-) Transcript_7172:3079-3729(-)
MLPKTMRIPSCWLKLSKLLFSRRTQPALTKAFPMSTNKLSSNDKRLPPSFPPISTASLLQTHTTLPESRASLTVVPFPSFTTHKSSLQTPPTKTSQPLLVLLRSSSGSTAPAEMGISISNPPSHPILPLFGFHTARDTTSLTSFPLVQFFQASLLMFIALVLKMVFSPSLSSPLSPLKFQLAPSPPSILFSPLTTKELAVILILPFSATLAFNPGA